MNAMNKVGKMSKRKKAGKIGKQNEQVGTVASGSRSFSFLNSFILVLFGN